MLRRISAVAGALIALVVASVPAGAAPSAHFNPPKGYYLALGDSISFGYQHQKIMTELLSGTYDPATFPGFVEPFAADMQAIRPRLQVENLACPGETSTTFFQAGACPFFAQAPGAPLHVVYDYAHVSQMQEALDIIDAHPGQVSPITIGLGANDLLNLQASCTTNHVLDPACVATGLPAVLATVGTNLDSALAQLRDADPSGEIIVLAYYNPEPQVPVAAPAVQALDGVIVQAAAAHDARVASAYAPFLAAGTCTVLPCTGGVPTDVHPSDAGYGVLAATFWAASGYDRLGG